MKLKLDENLPRRLKSMLSSLDHDVTTAEDEQLLSQPDAMVATAAKAGRRMLMTLDVEFGDLRKHPPGSHQPRSAYLRRVARYFGLKAVPFLDMIFATRRPARHNDE